jgi:hypothetical protein
VVVAGVVVVRASLVGAMGAGVVVTAIDHEAVKPSRWRASSDVNFTCIYPVVDVYVRFISVKYV